MDQFQALLPEGKSVYCLEDLSGFTMKDLKKILVVYKEKVSGIKADLVLRAYAIFTRISEPSLSIVTTSSPSPDSPGSNSFTYGFIKAQCSNLPWSSDLSHTPPFSFIQLYDYLVIRTVKYKHILLKSTEYKKLKAFQFYYEGFIKKLEVASNSDYCYFDVRMKASMRSKIYKVIVKLSKSCGNICSAACTCPAGTGVGGFGNCNHVGGVLFGLEDFNRKGLKESVVDINNPTSCTSKLSAWNVPRDCSSTPVTIDQVIIKKLKFGKESENMCLPKINLYDPRVVTDRTLDVGQFSTYKLELHSVLAESCFFLFHDMNPCPPQGQKQEVLEEVITMENIVPLPTNSNPVVEQYSSETQSFNDFYDISSVKFKSMIDCYSAKVSITCDKILEIELETRGQSSSKAWFDHRKHRITSSNFYSAARNTVEPSNKLKSMYYTSFTTTSTRHGIQNENHVLHLYETFLKSKNLDVCVKETGFIISKSHPYLGASLDGIVTNNKTGEKWGVEIKCPSSKFGQDFNNIVMSDKKFFLQKKGQQISLKKSHQYFYQVQGQMFCADLFRVDFVVWFGDYNPLYTETIFFDELFWSSKVLSGLDFFYRRAVLPEYFTRRVARDKKLYLQDGWVNHEEK